MYKCIVKIVFCFFVIVYVNSMGFGIYDKDLNYKFVIVDVLVFMMFWFFVYKIYLFYVKI